MTVQITQCKDCMHRKHYAPGNGYEQDYCLKHHHSVTLDFFCKDGKVKDEDTGK